ncbi:uncharacterized protein LOC144822710 [Lissotriton helveticus]
MERVRRTVLDPEQAFDELYKSLVRRNQDLFLNESRTGVLKRTYSAISARQSSTFSAAKDNVPGDSLYNAEFNLKHSESVVEKRTCHSATLSTHSEYLDIPGDTPLDLTTKTVADFKLQIQHQRSLVLEEYDSAAWTSENCTKEASDVSEEPLYSDTSHSEDENATVNLNEEVCRECLDRFSKTLKDPSAAIKEPDIVDPNHWACNYWMMSNGVRRKSVNLENRDFQVILKYLRAQARLPNVKSSTRPRRCSRPHVFLQRNLKLCRRSRRNSSSMKPKGWEKGKEKCPKDLNNPNTGKKLMCSSVLGKERVKKQLFIYKLDTDHLTNDNIKESLREDYDGTVTVAKKKQKSRDKGAEGEKFAQWSSESRMQDMVSGSQLKLKNVKHKAHGNSRQDSLLDTSESCLVGDPSSDSFLSVADSEEEGSELHSDGDSSPFKWVGGGSFREMLAKMSSRPSSKVVREYSAI